jgi:hypothetical protein
VLAELHKYHPANTKIDYSGVAPTPGCDRLGKIATVPEGFALRVQRYPDPRSTSLTIDA